MKANQFRAMMLVLLMAVVSLGVVNAQTLTVTGTVTDVADGTPIVGCSVMLKGTTTVSYTHLDVYKRQSLKKRFLQRYLNLLVRKKKFRL